MLENQYKDYKAYGNWDLRQLEPLPFIKAVPLCMLLSLPIGLWLTNNVFLWLVIGALVGVVVACEEIFEKQMAQTEAYITETISIEETSEMNSRLVEQQEKPEEGGAST